MPESRRSFFQSLVAGGATVNTGLSGKPLKHRKSDKQPNQRMYHGPMLVPADVAECLRESPDLHKTRATHLVARYVDGDGCVWLMRTRIPESRAMVGEIVRTPEGHYRVTCWSAATPSLTYRDARALIARHTEQEQSASAPILPPLEPPPPVEWDYFDPAFVEELLRDSDDLR
jgi:hypothetical protein